MKQLRGKTQLSVSAESLEDILTVGSALVVFDGLDELVDPTRRHEVVQVIESFCRRFPLVSAVVTSREVGYRDAELDKRLFAMGELSEFTDSEARDYARKWFQIVVSKSESSESAAELAESFDRESSRHAKDLRLNPLMLSLLCVIYKTEGYIPENRPEIYEKCSDLLLLRWDRVKRIPSPVAYGPIERNLVEQIAMTYLERGRPRSGFAEKELKQLVTQYYINNKNPDIVEARWEAESFLNFCSGRAWLLSEIGHMDGQRLFGFTHQTFAEFFAARHLARRARSARHLADLVVPYILDGSSEVAPQIAIQWFGTTRDHGADDCLNDLLYEPGVGAADRRRLPFVLRCLQYIPVAPATVWSVFSEAFGPRIERPPSLEDLARPAAHVTISSVGVVRHLVEQLAVSEDAIQYSHTKDLVRNLADLRWIAHRATEGDPKRREAWRRLLDAVDQTLIKLDEPWAQARPDVAAAWLLDGRMAVGDFVAAHGPSALLAVDTSYGPEPGPAVSATIRMLNRSGDPTDGERQALEALWQKADRIEGDLAGDVARVVCNSLDPLTLSEEIPVLEIQMIPVILVHAMCSHWAGRQVSTRMRRAAQTLLGVDPYGKLSASWLGTRTTSAVQEEAAHLLVEALTPLPNSTPLVRLVLRWSRGGLFRAQHRGGMIDMRPRRS